MLEKVPAILLLKFSISGKKKVSVTDSFAKLFQALAKEMSAYLFPVLIVYASLWIISFPDTHYL